MFSPMDKMCKYYHNSYQNIHVHIKQLDKSASFPPATGLHTRCGKHNIANVTKYALGFPMPISLASLFAKEVADIVYFVSETTHYN